MPRVRFEPTIPVFERAKKDHALDRAATVIGDLWRYQLLCTVRNLFSHIKVGNEIQDVWEQDAMENTGILDTESNRTLE
jgi:hypothetical protein